MDEKTTTEEPVDNSGADKALPDETQEEAAVDTEQDQSATTEESEGAEQALPQQDDKLAKFAKGIGIDDISSLSERESKLLKVAKDNQAEFQRTRQKASELEKTIDSGITQEAEAQGLSDDDRVEIHRIKTKLAVREFWDQDGVDKRYEPKMVQILQQKPHLAGDLEALYASAVYNDASSLKSEGGRKALESLAGKQRSAAPSGSATNTGEYSKRLTSENVDAEVAKMSPSEYAARRDEIQAIVGY